MRTNERINDTCLHITIFFIRLYVVLEIYLFEKKKLFKVLKGTIHIFCMFVRKHRDLWNNAVKLYFWL